jgi:hypothetical protein
MHTSANNSQGAAGEGFPFPPLAKIDWTPERLRFGGWLGLARRTAIFALAGILPTIMYVGMHFHRWNQSTLAEHGLIVTAIFAASVIGGWICELPLRARVPWGFVALLHYGISPMVFVALWFSGNVAREWLEGGLPPLRFLLAIVPMSIAVRLASLHIEGESPRGVLSPSWEPAPYGKKMM